MIAPTPPNPLPSSSGLSPLQEADRPSWLILASDGPVLDLPRLVPGTAIHITGDPRSFRDMLLSERPRIVVCCQPPAGDDDLELIARERMRRSRLRAVHISPPDAATARLAALARGFDDALTTTTTGQELAGRLGWLEERARFRPGPGASVPVGDDLELDLGAHKLRDGSTVIHLRPKEFGMLALLATHPGRVYTRRELMERVWGTGRWDGSRTVDVHVRWLRSKIEPDPEHPIHLVTVRGVGYRLDPVQR